MSGTGAGCERRLRSERAAVAAALDRLPVRSASRSARPSSLADSPWALAVGAGRAARLRLGGLGDDARVGYGDLELHVGRRRAEGRREHVVEARHRPGEPRRLQLSSERGRSTRRYVDRHGAAHDDLALCDRRAGSPGSTRSGRCREVIFTTRLSGETLKVHAGWMPCRRQVGSRSAAPPRRRGTDGSTLTSSSWHSPLGGSSGAVARLGAGPSTAPPARARSTERTGCCCWAEVVLASIAGPSASGRCRRAACRSRRRAAGRPASTTRGGPSRRAGAAVHADASPSPCAPRVVSAARRSVVQRRGSPPHSGHV